MLLFSKIHKTESFSVVIVGGKHEDISLVLKLFVKGAHSSQRRSFHNFFDMFRTNTELLGCWRVDLGHENEHDWDNWIAWLFCSNMLLCEMIENHEFPRLGLVYENMCICDLL